MLTQNDIAELQKIHNVSYTQVIALIEQRCRQHGDILVLRDWAHLDYTGYPFITTPDYRPILYAELSESCDIIRISITRDPVTQLPSLMQMEVMEEPVLSGVFGPDQFLVGYRKYAELCAETGFLRYEDFLLNPEMEMRKLCSNLQIKFDADFINKWSDYKTITGEVIASDSHDIKRPRDSNEILSPPNRPVEPGLKKKFLASDDYLRTYELLGYKLLEE